jgi:hypothetical protein
MRSFSFRQGLRMLGWVRVSAICVLGLSAFGLFANLMASYDLNSHGPSWTGTWYISDAAPSHLARSILDAAEGMFPVYDKTLGLVVPQTRLSLSRVGACAPCSLLKAHQPASGGALLPAAC